MKYMLDTNICIEIIRRRSVNAVGRCEAHAGDGICLSAISYSELLFGCEKSSHPAKNRHALEMFLSPIQVLDFPAAAGQATVLKLDANMQDEDAAPRPKEASVEARKLGVEK